MTPRQMLMRAIFNGLVSLALIGAAWLFWSANEPAYKAIIAFVTSALFGNSAIGYARRYARERKASHDSTPP